MKIFLAPHNDDETLFGAFTIQREKPLVIICTDGHIQFERGDKITAQQRRQESVSASNILRHQVEFLGIKDTELTKENLKEALKQYWDADVVYAPAVQGGNAQHDLVGQVAGEMFKKVIYYTTYTKTELWTEGNIEIVPTADELKKKNMALLCYGSQIALLSTRPHFQAVVGKSEWLI